MKILTAIVGCLALAVQATGQSTTVIVDTDAGSDDLMAIAYLLARPDVRIEAITVVDGMAHVRSGGANILKLLALSRHTEVPVYLGTETHLQETAEFPDAWRRISDNLPGVKLPTSARMPEKMEASKWLTSRLRDRSKPVVMLALGPLTNLARAIQHERSAALNLNRLVIMGGALHVPGNLGDGGAYKTKNTRAEWNIFADPLAAQIVFGSGAKIELIPLDATSKVPIDITFLKQFRALARTPLARFVTEVLESDHEAIEGGYFQAWDPLAAVSLTNPRVVTRVSIAVQVGADGSTAQTDGKPNATVALDANPEEFKRVFRKALQ